MISRRGQSGQRQFGVWDTSLREGHEDYKTFFLMAERGNFGVVRSHLLGYRPTQGSKSSKPRRMDTMFDQVVAELQPRYPVYANELLARRDDCVFVRHGRAEPKLGRCLVSG
jgi:hypothetical protein